MQLGMMGGGMKPWVLGLAVAGLAGVASAQVAGPSPSPGEGVVTNPDWSVKPSAADLLRFYPDRAQRYNVGGQARILCHVTAEGALDRCQVISETPTGYGIGDAALAAAKLFVMKPKTVDGQPVAGGMVVIPFNFAPPPIPSVTRSAPGDVVTANTPDRPAMVRRPDAGNLSAYYPASGGGLSGQATVSCEVTLGGALENCEVVSESPTGHGFGEAALRIAGLMQARPAIKHGQAIGGARVSIPLNFVPRK